MCYVTLQSNSFMDKVINFRSTQRKIVTCCNTQAEEIDHLISQQLTAMKAVRLKCFLLQSKNEIATTTDCLNKRQISYSKWPHLLLQNILTEREQCETILEDEKGLTVQRMEQFNQPCSVCNINVLY